MSRNDQDTSTVAKNWELNQYEMNRIPHEIIHDDTEIAISPQILQNELLCPICLDILKRTMTTKECLHRFCHDCIITALRAGNKECPTCRKKLASKRSLRPDPNFDGIIAKIYPNREEYDAMHERVLEKLKFKKALINTNQKSKRSQIKSEDSGGTSSNRVIYNEDTMDLEQQNSSNNHQRSHVKNNGKSSRLKQNSDVESDTESRASTEHSSSMHTEPMDEIEIILKPHPLKEFTSPISRFIKTTSNATVSHLSKYLWTRLTVDSIDQMVMSPSSSVSSSNAKQATPSKSATNSINQPESKISDFLIYFSSNETKISCFHLLNEDWTLEQVTDKYWKQNRPLELFYVYQRQSVLNGKQYDESISNGQNEIPNFNTNGNNSSSSCGSSTTSSSSSATNSNKKMV